MDTITTACGHEEREHCAAAGPRPEPATYVRIKFEPAGKAPRWYWARKIRPGWYLVVAKDGDPWRETKTAEVKEYLCGEPLEEKPARMSLHYAELELC